MRWKCLNNGKREEGLNKVSNDLEYFGACIIIIIIKITHTEAYYSFLDDQFIRPSY